MRKITVIFIILFLLLGGIISWFTWDHSIRDDITVFVIDSGFTPQFQPAIRGGSPGPVPGHGQLTSDIISSRAVRSVEVRELELTGDGEARRQNFLQHLEYIKDYAAVHSDNKVIVNISLAFQDFKSHEQAIIERLTQEGALIVAAAGNSGDESKFYPASYSGVFTITGANSRGRLTYATYGENIDLATSGHVSRFLPRNVGMFSLTRYEMQGTSFAAPRISGELARLAAVAEEDYSLQELAELSQQTAGTIDDNLFEEGKLGAGLFQASELEKLIAPQVYWRRLSFYGFFILIFPTLYFLINDVKYFWQLKKINKVATEAELINMLEDGRVQIWEKIKKEIEESSRFSREKFSKYLLFAKVSKDKKQEYLARLSSREIYSYVVEKLAEERTDPEKLARRLSRFSREKSVDLCYSVNWQKLPQIENKEKELRFILSLMRELDLQDKLVKAAASTLKYAEDPWLIYYSLRALQQVDISEFQDLVKESLTRIEDKRHPLYNREIKILQNKLAQKDHSGFS